MSAAPSIASLGSTAITTTSSVAVPVPSGVTASSLVLVWFWSYWLETSTVPSAAAFSPSSGFVLSDIQSIMDPVYNFYTASAWYYKYATGADSGTYTFGVSSVAGTAPYKSFGTAMLITGGPGSGNSFSDTLKFTGSGTAVSSISIPAFTPAGDNSLFIGGYVQPQATGISFPAGWTTDASIIFNTSQGIQAIGHNTQGAASNTGTLTFGSTGTASSQFAHMCIVRPPLPGMPWLRFN